MKIENNDGINVLSYFDGMSGGQIALKELGIKVNKYFAGEIDKFAIEQTQFIFPNTIQLGDVLDIDLNKLPRIDLFIGGSPCQGFSFAGKQLNFEDPRSKLFFEYAKALKFLQKKNPKIHFLLENVNMKKTYLHVINQYLDIFPVNLNSNKISAQNRNRWYWSNIRTKTEGLFSEIHTDIPEPIDKDIKLQDILQDEKEIDEKYYLTDVMNNYLKSNKRFSPGKINNKAKCLDTKSNRASSNYIKLDKQLKIKTAQNKASCLTAGGNSGGNHSDMDIILTKNYMQWDVSGKGYKSQQDRAFYENGKHGSLSSSRADVKTGVLIFKEATKKGYLRRLTPTECADLQTVPHWYKWIVSDTQIYKMLGNGWTIKMIEHIFSFLLKENHDKQR